MAGRLRLSANEASLTLVASVIAGWPFDNATCKMSGLVQGMSVSASVFTLVAIAVER